VGSPVSRTSALSIALRGRVEFAYPVPLGNKLFIFVMRTNPEPSVAIVDFKGKGSVFAPYTN